MSSQDAPRIYAIRLAVRALRDIEQAHSRLAEMEGDGIADAWQGGLLDAIGSLATRPMRQVAPESSRFPEEVRQFVYRRRPRTVAYRVLYVVRDDTPDGPTVFVIHVRHGSARPINRTEAVRLMRQPEDTT